jgi:glycosyltransferase involved in cell wall biosynthesis
MRVSVIISTYNSPAWLEKVLWGYQNQTHTDFEIIIADDGSGPDTEKLIKSFQQSGSLSIEHVWHEDKGYRRQTILNKAILKTRTEYLIFTDGDCIPRNDFISTHIRLAEKGYFLSGGYCKLPMDLSKTINQDDIITQRCFDVKWLRCYGLRGM